MKKSYSGFYICFLPFLIYILIIFQGKFSKYDIPFLVTVSIPFIIPFFHLAIRKKIWYKPYFMHKHNILTSKRRFQKKLHFSKEILFHKLLEVLKDSGLKIINTNEQTGDIFAISSMSWISFGENIYISLEEEHKGTIVDFQSVCLGRQEFWDKNKMNYVHMLDEFEKSLTI